MSLSVGRSSAICPASDRLPWTGSKNSMSPPVPIFKQLRSRNCVRCSVRRQAHICTTRVADGICAELASAVHSVWSARISLQVFLIIFYLYLLLLFTIHYCLFL